MKTPSKPKKTEGIDRINLVNEDEGDGDTEGDEDLDTEGEGDEEDEEEEESSLGLLRTGINKRGQVISKGFLPCPEAQIQTLSSAPVGDVSQSAVVKRIKSFGTEVMLSLASLTVSVNEAEAARSGELAQTIASLLEDTNETKTQSILQGEVADAKIAVLNREIADLCTQVESLTATIEAQVKAHEEERKATVRYLGITLPLHVPSEEKSVVEPFLFPSEPSQEGVVEEQVNQEVAEASSTSFNDEPKTGSEEERAEENK